MQISVCASDVCINITKFWCWHWAETAAGPLWQTKDKENWRDQHKNGVKKKNSMNSRIIQVLFPTDLLLICAPSSQSKQFPPISPELSVLFTISRDMDSTAPHSVTTYSCVKPLAKMSVYIHHFTDQNFPPLPAKLLRTSWLWYWHFSFREGAKNSQR